MRHLTVVIALCFTVLSCTLLARGQWDPNSPFIVASAPGNLIDGHNDIYNKNFVAFLSSYIASYIIEQQQARVAGTRTSAP